ncbi:MAG: CDP-glucose 4,6-dehydratase [Allosphingosinicella sp.]
MGERHAAVEELVAPMAPNGAFWKERRVLLTGHTGFKGAWLAVWLRRLGARVTGFALPAETEPSLWRALGADLVEREHLADLGDRTAVREAVAAADPEIVVHMAAQALVRRSYAQPVETFAANLMGTVHLLDALREARSLRAALIVTTDKVYANTEQGRDFVEDDPLGGHDPYSASKAAAEMATASYAAAFFEPRGVAVATARAGNVIGGGDWSEDRLVPDVWRAAASGETVALRNPQATRPWQHVVEPLAGYLRFVEALAGLEGIPRALNFGPLPGDQATVSDVAEAMARALGAPAAWRADPGPAPREMQLLSLDPARAATALGWRPRLGCSEAIEWTADWYSAHKRGTDPHALCLAQIEAYETLS